VFEKPNRSSITFSYPPTVVGPHGRGVDAVQDRVQARGSVHVRGPHGQGRGGQGVAQDVAHVHGGLGGKVEVVVHLTKFGGEKRTRACNSRGCDVRWGRYSLGHYSGPCMLGSRWRRPSTQAQEYQVHVLNELRSAHARWQGLGNAPRRTGCPCGSSAPRDRRAACGAGIGSGRGCSRPCGGTPRRWAPRRGTVGPGLIRPCCLTCGGRAWGMPGTGRDMYVCMYVFEWEGSTTVTHTVNYVCTPLFRLNASADAIAAQ
jgi:hypothetical protein